MGRWADRDSDEERLPEGFQRIGYDADTQTYTFRAPDGTIYESAEGNRYGELYPQDQRPFLSQPEVEAHNAQLKKSNRESVKMMLPFALLVIVFLLAMFRFLGGAGSGADDKPPQITCAEGARVVEIEKGDTCWAIAEAHGLGVEQLLGMEGNDGLDCDGLRPGHGICVPA
ncbi:hypothetical protein BU23DRAFT_592916 [Bimuria novae-zelandiae CBS 107.79]|uniref:LysM domain-containing protein n=1 Tax=Bimuria novae-zelandiae CBS 107.79 TaxID=1447943 RepID=A0A6A5UNN0_9PLEO|nr:hypothetical protein BU23DRAFT_592916 [Bimuria novae-zelandiae CBS 107.79]